jgi:hypothetical protein
MIVKLYLPMQATHITASDGHTYQVQADADGRLFAVLPIESARSILTPTHITGDTLKWRQVNQTLVEALGKPELKCRSIRVFDYAQAMTPKRPKSALDMIGEMKSSITATLGMVRGRG